MPAEDTVLFGLMKGCKSVTELLDKIKKTRQDKRNATTEQNKASDSTADSVKEAATPATPLTPIETDSSAAKTQLTSEGEIKEESNTQSELTLKLFPLGS